MRDASACSDQTDSLQLARRAVYIVGKSRPLRSLRSLTIFLSARRERAKTRRGHRHTSFVGMPVTINRTKFVLLEKKKEKGGRKEVGKKVFTTASFERSTIRCSFVKKTSISRFSMKRKIP